MKRTHSTLAYFMLQGTLWGLNAVLIGFTSNFLYRYGFQDHHISLFMGLTTALACVFQLGAAELISRIRNLNVYRVLLTMSLVSICGSVGMLEVCPGPVPVFGLALNSVVLQMGPAMVNSMGVEAIDRGSDTNFGVGRGGGSLFYSVMALVTGQLVARFGSQVLAVLGAVLAVAFLASILWYQRICSRLEPAAEKFAEKRQETQKGNFLKSYPLFTVLLVGSILLFISHSLLCNFMLQIATFKGGGAAEQGMANSIAALAELPIMFGFGLLLKKVRCERWIQFSALFFLVKAVLIYFASDCAGIFAAQATQMLGFAIFLLSTVEYAKMVIGPEETVRAQSYLSSTTTIGGLVASSTGGFLCKLLSAEALILVAVITAALGAAVTVAVIQYEMKQRAAGKAVC